MSENISATVVKATRGFENAPNGLISMVLDVPAYIWMELLTHKRFARNASSSRYQSANKHVAMGHYNPQVFWTNKDKEGVSHLLNLDDSSIAMQIWETAWAHAVKAVEQLTALGVSREQANRVLPTFKMMRGMLTGTEDAWRKMLMLRDSLQADTAMQRVAHMMREQIKGIKWDVNFNHYPLAEDGEDYFVAVGRIARLSLGSEGNDKEKAVALTKRLKKDNHMSPFEHCASYNTKPLLSAICNKAEDIYFFRERTYGWSNVRARIEEMSVENRDINNREIVLKALHQKPADGPLILKG